MTALGRAADPALLQRTLGLVLSDKIRMQDAMIPIGAVASNAGDAGRDLAWRFVKENWDVLFAKASARARERERARQIGLARADRDLPTSPAAASPSRRRLPLAQLGATFGIWAHVLGAATSNFASKAMADEIGAFFEKHPTGPAARTIKQSLEAIRARAWRVHLLKADIDAVSKLNFSD